MICCIEQTAKPLIAPGTQVNWDQMEILNMVFHSGFATEPCVAIRTDVQHCHVVSIAGLKFRVDAYSS